MNVINGLIIKDFKTIKSFKSTVLYMLFIFGLSAFLENDIMMFIPFFIPLSFGMIGISSFSYDNFSKVDKYVLTFPLNKKDVVKAKYIYVLLLIIIGALFGVLVATGMGMIKGFESLNISQLFEFMFGGICGIIILQSFQIPMIYKFGAEKYRVVQMGVIILFMILVSCLVTFSEQINSVFMENVKDVLVKYGVFIFIGLPAFLYFLSYRISCKIYEKKEV